MDKFTLDIAKVMMQLLWYLSNYPDFDDYSETTRRDFIEAAVDCLRPHLPDRRNDIHEIFTEFKEGFADHPYKERAATFAKDFLEILEDGTDPSLLFWNGKKFR